MGDEAACGVARSTRGCIESPDSGTLPAPWFVITTSSGTGAAVFTNLVQGTYDITEVVPNGWDLITSYCDNGEHLSGQALCRPDRQG